MGLVPQGQKKLDRAVGWAAFYIFIISVSVVAVPFYRGMLYSYFFKKIPD
jgi:hypothetical protein